MANGIIIIDKPQGWTSMDVCAKLRGIFREKRVGHAGTLDPMATGVLPVFLGRATRAVEFAAEGEKEYVAGIRFGLVTNTQDTTGEVVETRPAAVTGEELDAVLDRFRGEIEQIPPMYSAIKINGKKLYELARKGREVERKPRAVTIFRLERLEKAPFGWPEEEQTFFLRVRCSKGTYIRTLCHDLGQVLGCGAAMSALRRSQACGFGLERAVTLEQLQAAADAGRAEELLQSVDGLFSRLPALTVTANQERRVRSGTDFSLNGWAEGDYRVYAPDGSFLMVGRVADGKLTTVKSFFEV